MKQKKAQHRDYIIIVNLIMFFVVTVFVATSRLVLFIKHNPKPSQVEESMYMDYNQSIVDFKVQNLKIIKAIKNVYGIDLHYGAESKDFALSVDAIDLKSDETAFAMLKEVIIALNKYPKKMLGEMQKNGYIFSIYLVDHFTNGNVALANRNSNNEFKIYLSNTSEIERTMHHETYHIIEYYMKLEKKLPMIYNSWNKYNPKGFSYTNNINTINTNYVYGYEKSVNNICFITLYSKFSEKEDRAEIFANNMMLTSLPIYYSETSKIRKKSQALNNTIKTSFESFNIYNTKFEWDLYI